VRVIVSIPRPMKDAFVGAVARTLSSSATDIVLRRPRAKWLGDIAAADRLRVAMMEARQEGTGANEKFVIEFKGTRPILFIFDALRGVWVGGGRDDRATSAWGQAASLLLRKRIFDKDPVRQLAQLAKGDALRVDL